MKKEGIQVTILGCGTSGGVPRIGGPGGRGIWGACDPDNPRNRRRRVSILVQSESTSVLVDTSPDFREQALDAGIEALDAVLYTHDHADHTHGIDDLRGLSYNMARRIEVYAQQRTLETIQRRFDYIFTPRKLYPAFCNGHVIDGPFKVGDIDISPIPQIHGNSSSLGFRFGPVAYSTDFNDLSEPATDALKGVKVWIVDALRYDPHPTHVHLDQTLRFVEQVKPERAVLTHMAWDMDYETLRAKLPDGVEPAFDGMVIEA
ncbi:MAG: MBL fold metallo-hydrolase [Sphingomonadales bacterium]